MTSTLLTDELRALVGRTAVYTAPEPLGRAALRYFATAVGDTNPCGRTPVTPVRRATPT